MTTQFGCRNQQVYWHSCFNIKTSCYLHLGERQTDNTDKDGSVSVHHYMAMRLGQHIQDEKKLDSFHLCCLRSILKISQKDKVPSTEVLSHTDIPTMYSLHRQCRLHWLGHVHQMEQRCIPKDILYAELISEKIPAGCPQLHFKASVSMT